MELTTDFISDWMSLVHTELTAMGYSIPATSDRKATALLYFNALFRRIPAKPRRIRKSSGLQCPPQLEAGLKLLEQKVLSGDDLNPHLSRKLTTLDFDDALLNDWHIFHFHLGTGYLTNGMIKGTDPVLFARVTESDFYEISFDSHHNGWADMRWLEILHSNWPEAIEPYKRPEIIALGHVPDTATFEAFRRGQGDRGGKINSPFQTKDGTVYSQPGGGYASDGTSLIVVNQVNLRVREIERFEKELKKKPELYLGSLKERGYNESAALNASFVVENDGWYASFPKWNFRLRLRDKGGYVL